MFATEGLDWDALPEARLCKDEEVGARLNNGGGNHKVTLSGDADPDDTAGRTSHRPRLLLMEAADATLSRGEHNVVFARCWNHLCKFVALIKGDRNNS